MNTVYQWRDGFRISTPADDVGPVIEDLLAKYDTGLMPSQLVREAALRPRTPLHRCFEWDDAKAAYRFRLTQANTLLRALVVTRRDQDIPASKPQRVALSVRPSPTSSPVYLKTQVVMQDAHLRQLFLEQARRDLEVWRHRFGEIKELHRFFSSVESQLSALAG